MSFFISSFSLFYISLIRDALKLAISQAISQRVARCVEIKFLSMLNKREQKTVNSDSCLNNYIELKQTIHNWWSHPGLSFYSAFTIFHEWNFLFKIRNQQNRKEGWFIHRRSWPRSRWSVRRAQIRFRADRTPGNIDSHQWISIREA